MWGLCPLQVPITGNSPAAPTGACGNGWAAGRFRARLQGELRRGAFGSVSQPSGALLCRWGPRLLFPFNALVSINPAEDTTLAARRQAEGRPRRGGLVGGFGAVAMARGEGALFLAAGLALGDGAALVPLAATAGEAEFDLGVASLEVELEGYDGEAALGGEAGEVFDFAAVEEELAGARGVEVVLGGGFVGGYVEVVEPGIAALDARVGLAEVDAAVPNGLDFGASEDEAGVVGLHYLVVVSGFSVDGDDFLVRHH